MGQRFSAIIWALILLASTLLGPVSAAEKQSTPRFENEQLRLRLSPRTTEQMAAFFEARGFPKVMIQHLSSYCFFTVTIKNKTNKPLWLNLTNWAFSAGPQQLSRIPRSTWPPIWKELHIPQAAQATFRWTLLPEALRFYANESEGGNVILQKSGRPFMLRARFVVGEEKSPLVATLNNLRCADAKEESK